MSGKDGGERLKAAPGGGVDRPYMMRGVRGATTASEDTPEAIEHAVHELLAELVAHNALVPDELAAVFFSVTEDLQSAFPASAARSFGWDAVPLLDVREASADGDLSRCVRVLLLWNTRRAADDIRHVYLRGARALRPDLCGQGSLRLPLAGG